MGMDFHKVCKCGSYFSDYLVSTGERQCRGCGLLLSVHGEYTENSPCFGMSEKEIQLYFNTDVDPRK